jgi:hypothetical protein
MLSHSLPYAEGGVWLIASIIIAGAQETANRAAFTNVPKGPATTGLGCRAYSRSNPAPDIRTLIADPAIKNFRGPTENAYDFTDPDGCPALTPPPLLSSREGDILYA